MTKNKYISDIFIDENGLPVPSPERRHERDLAIYDILQQNKFSLDERLGEPLPDGPFVINLALKNSLLLLEVRDKLLGSTYQLHFSLTPLKPIMKDYFEICKSYFDAVKRLPPSQIETIDMGRRGIHLEGSRVLIERLDGKIKTDIPTAKRLFTLVCTLHSN